MIRKAGIRAAALAALLTLVLAGVAIAAGSTPTLGSPNGKSVSPGAIKLVVNIPLRPHKKGVFIAISPTRKVKGGHLTAKCNVNQGCDFVAPTRVKGHKWAYVAKFNFPGYWAVTPGKYYWQVHYYQPNFAVHFSKIGSFTVK
jgi:hypothetical protein